MNNATRRSGGTARTVLARLAFAGALVLVLGPTASFGENTAALPRFALTADGGPVFVQEEGFGNGWRLGTGVFFRTGHRMGTEILIDRFNVPVALGAAGLPSAGRMSMAALLLEEQLYVLTEGPVLPFALLGIGFSFPTYHPATWPADTPRRVFVDRMALQIGGGLDLRITSRLALHGKVRYNLVKTWMEDEGRTEPIRDVRPLEQDMLRLYGLELGLGLKISF